MFKTHTLLSSPALKHGFFTNHNGVSTGIYKSLNLGLGSHDNRKNILENRSRVHAALNLDTLCTVNQIHSADVTILDTGKNDTVWDVDSLPHADAIVTNMPNVAIGALTADCAPVLFADVKNGIVGCAHAGWKGAVSGILQNTVIAMEKLGAEKSNICAVVGACIQQSSFETSSDFYDTLLEKSPHNSKFFIRQSPQSHLITQQENSWFFDLSGYCLEQLQHAGLNADSVDRLPDDTYMVSQDYFSYRRCTHLKQHDYGRQISAIGIL